MKLFKKNQKKYESKLAQFIRFTMLGLCSGIAIMLLQTMIFAGLVRILLDGELPLPGRMNYALSQVVDWMDELIMAPVVAYFAGRLFMKHRWKFVFSMFLGIELFRILITFATELGLPSPIEIGFFLTAVVLGGAISLITYKRGIRSAEADQKEPETLEKKVAVPVPMPLSQIDYTEVAKRLKEEEAAKSPSEEPAQTASASSENAQTTQPVPEASESTSAPASPSPATDAPSNDLEPAAVAKSEKPAEPGASA